MGHLRRHNQLISTLQAGILYCNKFTAEANRRVLLKAECVMLVVNMTIAEIIFHLEFMSQRPTLATH